MKQILVLLKTVSCVAIPVFIFISCGDNTIWGEQSFADLEEDFRISPDSVKPYVYWYWINDNISKEGAVRDLKAMAEVGIGGAFIGNIGLDNDEIPYGEIKLMSEEWRDIIREAIQTASEEGWI